MALDRQCINYLYNLLPGVTKGSGPPPPPPPAATTVDGVGVSVDANNTNNPFATSTGSVSTTAKSTANTTDDDLAVSLYAGNTPFLHP